MVAHVRWRRLSPHRKPSRQRRTCLQPGHRVISEADDLFDPFGCAPKPPTRKPTRKSQSKYLHHASPKTCIILRVSSCVVNLHAFQKLPVPLRLPMSLVLPCPLHASPWLGTSQLMAPCTHSSRDRGLVLRVCRNHRLLVLDLRLVLGVTAGDDGAVEAIHQSMETLLFLGNDLERCRPC
jgi:hypothetical protein